MKKFALFGLVVLATSAMADEANLKKQLEKMGATNVNIRASVLPGFKTAIADQGVLQISEDGRFVIQGKVLELKNGKAIDVTNQALMAELNGLSDEMIIYPAKNQKHVVTVFVDITCHYCHILYEKLSEYNELGITVRLLAFPRAGLSAQTARQMEAIWTAKDKVQALKEAENGNPPKELKTPNLVKKHYELGVKFSVTGTPNIVTESGELIGGYVEPKELLKMLNE